MRNNPVQITRKANTKIEPVETGEYIGLTESDKRFFESFANVLEYPTENWRDRLDDFSKQSRLTGRSDSVYFADFYRMADETPILELQEFYTRTFDLSPVCALEIGYHLFGEDYKRGAFLARLRETENPYELCQENQLPDYLPVVLRLLARMEDEELRAEMTGFCVLPALNKMGEQLEKKKNWYGNAINFAEETLKRIAEDSVRESEEIPVARFQNA